MGSSVIQANTFWSLESVEEDFGIIDASEVCSEKFDLGIERFCVSVCASAVEECQYALDVEKSDKHTPHRWTEIDPLGKV
ncbi:MAG: hypothetical protein RL377_307 [Bacteroidota bacterium]